MVQFGELFRNSILYPIPHRKWVFKISVMLRVYFKYDRHLLSDLQRCAYDSLCIFSILQLAYLMKSPALLWLSTQKCIRRMREHGAVNVALRKDIGAQVKILQFKKLAVWGSRFAI